MPEATAPDSAAAEVVPNEATADEDMSVHGCLAGESLGQLVVHPSREQYVALVKALADDGYAMCIDLTAVDYLTNPTRRVPAGVTAERFEIVVNLLSMQARARLRLRIQVPAEDPAVPTLFDLYPGTEALEREVYDMFGIVFTDHPDLTRILMPEDWEGHPLRKDDEIGAIPVQFSSAVPGEGA